MEDREIKKLHRVLILITREINRICKKNDIKYSLIGGSMLGAIRHQGFIPWDDDLDIGMLREEYERFLKACTHDLDSRFEVQTNENDENYVYGFTKILLRDTSLVQYGHEKTKHKKGIYVDIFPYDYIPDDKKLRSKQNRLNYLLIKMLQRKFGEEDRRNWCAKEWVAFHLIDIANFFVSKKYLIQCLNRNLKMYSNQKSTTVSNMSGYYGYERESVPSSYFENFVEVLFENETFPILSEYDAFLTSYYGDYMELPPVEKRRTHGFRELDFGPYKDI